MLITGKGLGGSWMIRGEQLGHEIGATVIPKASLRKINAANSILCIKKPNKEIQARTSTAPLIWDIVDSWPQGGGKHKEDGSTWDQSRLTEYILKVAKSIRPDILITATQKMAQDLGTIYPTYSLRHHGRTYQNKNQIKENVTNIIYEGVDRYIDQWLDQLTTECKQRGWLLNMNQGNILDADIVIALRGAPYRGYASDNWKSNIKLQNAQNSGTPIICSREAGYLETQSGGEIFADTPEELTTAFDYLTPQENRLMCSELLQKQEYYVADAARDFLKIWPHG